MIARVAGICSVALFIAGAAHAGAPEDKARKPAKVTEIHVCPQTGESVKGEPAGSEVVGKYKVFFCCAGCKDEFAKLTPAEKQAKVAEVAPKTKPGKKG